MADFSGSVLICESWTKQPLPPHPRSIRVFSISCSEISSPKATREGFVSGDPECLVFTLLAIQQCIANASQDVGPNTPSAAIPAFAKPPTKPKNRKGKKKRGGQPGHAGRTREPLPEPDRTREHILDCCPVCHGPLKRTGDKRTRRSEDIPEDLKPVITEDILHRDYCPAYQKRVEPRLPDVLPRCTLGNRTRVLSAMLHFLQGLTLGQIVDTFTTPTINI